MYVPWKRQTTLPQSYQAESIRFSLSPGGDVKMVKGVGDKDVVFLGSALANLRDFPDTARREAGYQLDRVQHGFDPMDWKPMNHARHPNRQLISPGGVIRHWSRQGRDMRHQRVKNVFEALESDPAVAENLKIRSQLMSILSEYIRKEGLTQKQAAELFEVSQPRVSDLTRGKIERFTIDMLITMLARTGKHVQVKVSSRAA